MPRWVTFYTELLVLCILVHGTWQKTPEISVYEGKLDGFSGEMMVNWTIDTSLGEVSFDVEAQTKGWVGIGFSTNTLMVGTDMVVGWVEKDGTVSFEDRYAHSRSRPRTDVDRGGSDDLLDKSISESEDGVTRFHFRRKLDTGDEEDIAIPKTSKGFDDGFYLLLALSRHDGEASIDSFDEHASGYVGIFRTNLITGEITVVSQSRALATAHGVIMVLAFPVCMAAGIAVARFTRKATAFFFPLHVALQMVGIALAIVGFGIIVRFINTNRRNHFNSAHTQLGFVLFFAIFLQPVLGMLAYKLWKPFRNGTPIFPDKLHWYLGWGILVLSLPNCFLGLDRFEYVYEMNVSPALWGFLAAWIFAVAVMFLYLQYVKKIGPEELIMKEQEADKAANMEMIAPYRALQLDRNSDILHSESGNAATDCKLSVKLLSQLAGKINSPAAAERRLATTTIIHMLRRSSPENLSSTLESLRSALELKGHGVKQYVAQVSRRLRGALKMDIEEGVEEVFTVPTSSAKPLDSVAASSDTNGTNPISPRTRVESSFYTAESNHFLDVNNNTGKDNPTSILAQIVYDLRTGNLKGSVPDWEERAIWAEVLSFFLCLCEWYRRVLGGVKENTAGHWQLLFSLPMSELQKLSQRQSPGHSPIQSPRGNPPSLQLR